MGAFSACMTKIFPKSFLLYEYIRRGSNQQVEILKQDDPISYKSLLKESFICCEKIETLEIEKSNEKCPVRDIVNRFTANFVRAPSTSKDQNCLCLGYRSKGSFSDAIMRNYIDIECTFVNTIQSIVTSQTWQILADRIGKLLYCIKSIKSFCFVD